MDKKEILNQILELSNQSKTATEIGAVLGLTKNTVMGRIYRHKVKNGYSFLSFHLVPLLFQRLCHAQLLTLLPPCSQAHKNHSYILFIIKTPG